LDNFETAVGWNDGAVAEVRDRLVDFNLERTGLEESQPRSVVHRDHNDRIDAGIVSYIWGGVLTIDWLWVDTPLRGNGIGTRMLGDAEEWAIARDCHMAYLTTYAFQSPAFYLNGGYHLVMDLPDAPVGHSLLVFVKPLGPAVRLSGAEGAPVRL
jgi:GNAT superfamily N-acetyltransferase